MGFQQALILAAAISMPLCQAAEAIPPERVKAAFLYKFAAYVEWPAHAFPQPESPIVIGVAGADAIAAELEQAIPGRKVGGRPIAVRRLGRDEAANADCHILFIGSGEKSAAEILTRAQGHPVLTVTDAEAAHPKGSIINFLAAEGRVRFDISRESAERNGLQLRSQLLKVARQVGVPMSPAAPR